MKAGTEQHEVLVMKTDILKQVRELSLPPQPDIFTPYTAADVVFSVSTDTAAVCQNHGRVYASGSPDPTKCVATGRETEAAVVGEKATALLDIVSLNNGGTCVDAIIEIELVSEITGRRVTGNMERSMEPGQYVTSYHPTVKGRHLLQIT